MVKAIFFDYDGVILDSFDFHHKNINKFTNSNLNIKKFKNMYTGNFFESVPESIKKTNWNKYVLAISKEHDKLKIDKNTQETLIKLSKKYKLFVVSSGGFQNISNSFKNNKLENVFTEILALESSKSKIQKFEKIFKKYNLTNSDCIFITDTLGDIIEANKINLRTIGVTKFSYHNKKTLEQGKPIKIISNLNKIEEFINNQ